MNRPHLGDNWPWALVCVPALVGLTVWAGLRRFADAVDRYASMAGDSD
jgi:hypothetical protein